MIKDFNEWLKEKSKLSEAKVEEPTAQYAGEALCDPKATSYDTPLVKGKKKKKKNKTK